MLQPLTSKAADSTNTSTSLSLAHIICHNNETCLRKHASSLCHIVLIQQKIITCDFCDEETFKRFGSVFFFFHMIADDERRVKHGGHHVPSSRNPLSSSKDLKIIRQCRLLKKFTKASRLHMKFTKPQSLSRLHWKKSTLDFEMRSAPNERIISILEILNNI
ncbi:hypothetical protein YC2023_119381 [Brassica napus]